MSISSKFMTTCASAATAILVAAPQAHAEPLVSLFDYRIVERADDGAEVLVERATVKPGETIEYSITHENTAEDDLSGIVVTAPIPDGATLAVGSQSSSADAVFEIQAEIEPETPGLEWATLPAFRKFIDQDGVERIEPVPASAIEAVRWSLDTALLSGQTTLNTYRVTVD